MKRKTQIEQTGGGSISDNDVYKGYLMPCFPTLCLHSSGPSHPAKTPDSTAMHASCPQLAPVPPFILYEPIYAALALRMSESPASRIAMVEQRKSFPQAVPSSICRFGFNQHMVIPPQPVMNEAASQGSGELCLPEP
jgi:hypothetical protein